MDASLLARPHRDRLDRHGTHFRQAWCATPQCSPARGALWTGLWPHRTGLVANIDAVGAHPLTPKTPSIGRVFRDAGYRTGYFGKWHLTENSQAKGEAFGFDTLDQRSNAEGDDGVARKAAEWIEAQGDQPWLAIVSILQPHDIYHYPDEAKKRREANEPPYPIRKGMPAPKSDETDLKSRPEPQSLFLTQDQGTAVAGWDAQDWRRYRSYYYELIEAADRSLGVVLDALDRAGQTTRTVVAYTSDHGDGQGEHGLPFKGPFQYEELLNIPLTISHAGHLRARVSPALASQVDLLPTLCDMAGVAAPTGVDGVSLRPVLRGERFERQELFAEYHSKQKWANPIRTVRTERWKLNVYLDGGQELYDLKRDPHELRNLSGTDDHSQIEKDLLKRLEAHAKATEDKLWFESEETRGT